MYADVAKYKGAFERIRKIGGQESSLDKIVADFVKVEDQNFALFNYVTEMNNQVRHAQVPIRKRGPSTWLELPSTWMALFC